jgi:oligoribonuclease NrnB/cAMP/cGMP phosphodiesterase (DHH superfamily)
MSPFTIVSLTHSDDFDGIGSQAIIHRYFSVLKKPLPKQFANTPVDSIDLILLQTDYQDYLFYWAAFIVGYKQKLSKQPLNFEKEWIKTVLELHNVQTKEELISNFNTVSDAAKKRILDMSKRWKEIDLIIITDIGYNKIFTSLLPMIEKQSIPFAYFDHHNHDLKSKNFYKKHCAVQIINTKKCGTQIVQEFFLQDDLISQKISDIGVDTDFSKYELSNSRKIMSLISYYRKDWDYLRKIVENYASGEFFDNNMEKDYQDVKKWEDSEFRHMKKGILEATYTFPDGKLVHFIVGVSNLRAGRSMSRLEEALKDKALNHPSKLVSEHPLITLTIDRTQLNSNIHSQLIDVHKIAEYFGGGGHTHRAGFIFPPNLIIKGNIKDFNSEDINLQKFFKIISDFI